MAIDSARLALPFIEAGQAQKEWTHNEALALLDIAVQATVEGIADAPPADPASGACWIVGSAPSGAWIGRAGSIAGWTAGGWRFVAPREGMAAWHLAEGTIVRRRSSAWRLDRVASIAAPAGGPTVDVECRAAVAAILAALRTLGVLT
jgi:hypothetical protein